MNSSGTCRIQNGALLYCSSDQTFIHAMPDLVQLVVHIAGFTAVVAEVAALTISERFTVSSRPPTFSSRLRSSRMRFHPSSPAR